MQHESVLEANGRPRTRRSHLFITSVAVLIGVAQAGWLALLFFGLKWLIQS